MIVVAVRARLEFDPSPAACRAARTPIMVVQLMSQGNNNAPTLDTHSLALAAHTSHVSGTFPSPSAGQNCGSQL